MRDGDAGVAINEDLIQKYMETPCGNGRYRCLCGLEYRLTEKHKNKRFCPYHVEMAQAIHDAGRKTSAITRAANSTLEIAAHLGQLNNEKKMGISTVSTNGVLQVALDKLRKTLNVDTREEAVGTLLAEQIDHTFGLNQRGLDGVINQTPGYKGHLKIQMIMAVVKMIQEVETLSAAKTLDLSGLEHDDLVVLLKPVAKEMLMQDREFLEEVLSSMRMQVMTEAGDLLGV